MEEENIETPKSDQASAHQELYKYNGLADNQDARRNELLGDLKRRRNDQIDKLRGIGEFFGNDASDEEEPVDAIEQLKKRHGYYGRKFMLSEWLREIPMDLEDEWVFKICPIGVRNLVVAHKGVTKVFNRRNKLKAMFQSCLPGGNRNTRLNTFTLLDCIYRNQEKSYYVLDVLVWNSNSYVNCSTEFRFFFVKSKLLEDLDSSTAEKFKFVNVEYYPALLPTLESQLMNPYIVNDKELAMDGVLFYHKDCRYTSGFTPLVGWLKPYMIPEKLQLPVHEMYLARRPDDYTNLEEYLELIALKYPKKKKPRKEVKEITPSLPTEAEVTVENDKMEAEVTVENEKMEAEVTVEDDMTKAEVTVENDMMKAEVNVVNDKMDS